MSMEIVFRIWSARVRMHQDKSEVYWLSHSTGHFADPWQFQDISGPEDGIKFDRLELVDLDKDGDLDVLTCEERDGLA